MSYAKKSAKMHDPPAQAQGSFLDDYQGTPDVHPPGMALASDIEGKLLNPGALAAGRRIWGGFGEPVGAAVLPRAADALGARVREATGRELGTDLGRYIRERGPDGGVVRQTAWPRRCLTRHHARVWMELADAGRAGSTCGHTVQNLVPLPT